MIHETFTVDGPPDLEVSIESGRVEVREGPPGKVEVKVDTKLPDFVVEQRGNSITISSDRSSWLSRGAASVVISTPAGTDLRVAVASAQIQCDLDLGKVEIKTASGDIEMGRAETLVVRTSSGDLDIRSVERSLRFTSASGDMRVSNSAGGSLGVSTASGDVDIEASDATIDITSASGDAAIRQFTGRSAYFKTMSGNVDLGIPSGSSVELDVSTLSGKVRLPDPEPRQGPAQRQMSVRAKLVSGDFTIVRA
ncbi:MAG TPA: DUF4097 family beta strand repeat-containing protein [Acidimicrobiia bacterium]